MDSIVKRLMENRLSEGHGDRGERSLRSVLQVIARELRLENYDDSVDYDLHHADGNHYNNEDLNNLVLLPHNVHASYNNKLRSLGINQDSPEAIEVLNRDYSDHCVFVGSALLALLKKG